MVSPVGANTGSGLDAVLSRIAAIESQFGALTSQLHPPMPGSPAVSAGAAAGEEATFAESLSRAERGATTQTADFMAASGLAARVGAPASGARTIGYAAPGAGTVRGVSALAPGGAAGLVSPVTAAPAAPAMNVGVAPPSEGMTGLGVRAVELAKEHLGVPYQWGGESPATGFDCSGLVQHTFKRLGVHLPRVSRDQAKAGQPIASLAEARPGDLVAFGEPVDHIGIYAGGGKMVVAPHTGAVVRVQDITRPIVAIRRVA